MKILIDINHPAHVHYFKNFIEIMEHQGNVVIVTNRDEPIINDLLDVFKINHFTRCKRPVKNTFFLSLKYLLSMIFDVYGVARKEKIDFFIGFASVPCAFLSFLYKKPSVIIDDTEHNGMNHFIYSKFCSDIITPFYFKKDMGEKQIYFKAYVEQFYLHSNYFSPPCKSEIPEYALVRFISYSARHDKDVKSVLNLEDKKTLVKELAKRIKVYVSMESEPIDPFFLPFKLDCKPEQMHSIISNASIFITEGATMASEAGLLGVKYFYINPLKVGNVDKQCELFDHAHQLDGKQLLENINALDLITEINNDFIIKLERETIDPTKFLVWFINNYPNSSVLCRKKMIDIDFVENNNLVF